MVKVYLGRELLGLVGQIHPKMAQAYDITETLALEINLEVLLKNKPGKVKFTEVSKYPSISRDLAFVVKEDVKGMDIITLTLRKTASWRKRILSRMWRCLMFTPENMEKEKLKSIALSIVFQSAQRTLKDADINEIHNRILETLEKDLHAQKLA